MDAFFLDSSALVKRYVREIGTPRVVGLTDPGSGHRLYVARIAGVEVVSAIARQVRAGTIDPSDASWALGLFKHHFAHEYRILEMTSRVFDRATNLAEVYVLRAYDAVQLASALEITRRRIARRLPPAILVSSDGALNAAASQEGLLVEDPTLNSAHP